jgi:hypothetical protein
MTAETSRRRGRGKAQKSLRLIETATDILSEIAPASVREVCYRLFVAGPDFRAETKRRDPRYRWFVGNFGRRCWELDVLSPVVLRDRVELAVLDRVDRAAWHRAEVVERAEQESLESILNAWPGISRPAQQYPVIGTEQP